MSLTINLGSGYVGYLSFFVGGDKYAAHFFVKSQSWLWGLGECWQMGTGRRWKQYGFGPLFMVVWPDGKYVPEEEGGE